MNIVTPSNWLAECARSSSLFKGKRIVVIPNGLDVVAIRCIDKQVARSMFSLDPEKKYILFGAVNATSDKNKGFQHVVTALKTVAHELAALDCELLVFGGYKPTDSPDFGLKSHYVGYLHDEVSMNLLYSAADVFVAPSLQENLPNTIMEAMARGVPTVAFSVGGIPDLVTHKENGYLAQPYDTVDLAQGLLWVLSGSPSWDQLSRSARDTVHAQFSIDDVAGKHYDLYSQIVGNPGA